jgi:hypothetical protein
MKAADNADSAARKDDVNARDSERRAAIAAWISAVTPNVVMRDALPCPASSSNHEVIARLKRLS